jgi:uncharacterized protein (TIGR00251 family)
VTQASPPPSALLRVKVVPGASRDALAGRHGDGVRVRVSAPPERGQANEAVARVLAQALGVDPRRVVLVAGAASPRKVFRIEGLPPEALSAWLAALPARPVPGRGGPA